MLYGCECRPDNAAELMRVQAETEDGPLFCLNVDPMWLYARPLDEVREGCRQIRDVLGDKPVLSGTADATVPGTEREKLKLARDMIVGC